MSRPTRERRILGLSESDIFKPAGVPARQLAQVELPLDELEAIRLVDLQGLSHEDAAVSLGVSRQTVGRMLENGRRKVADALTNGRAILVGGGAFRIAETRWCGTCHDEWVVEGDRQSLDVCPRCGSTDVRACVGGGGGRGRGHGCQPAGDGGRRGQGPRHEGWGGHHGQATRQNESS